MASAAAFGEAGPPKGMHADDRVVRRAVAGLRTIEQMQTQEHNRCYSAREYFASAG
jgi:hypothetical protein